MGISAATAVADEGGWEAMGKKEVGGGGCIVGVSPWAKAEFTESSHSLALQLAICTDTPGKSKQKRFKIFHLKLTHIPV